MENNQVSVSLVGASTYFLRGKIYRKGEPVLVTSEVWDEMKEDVSPSTGVAMFCLTSEVPPEPEKAPDISSADLKTQEIDTGLDQGAKARASQRVISVGSKGKAVTV